jgi:amino acid adenylation domain-containing protein
VTDQNVPVLSEAKRALLAQRLRGREAGNRAVLRSLPRAPGQPVPLSTAQEQLWYFSQLAPDNPVYNEAVTIRKEGPFDADAFARAFNEVVRRHDSWHSTFEVIDGVPMQRVRAAPTYELPVIDLRGVPADDREHAAAMAAVEDSRRPYDLARGPLIRPRLVRMADEHHRLYLSLHHLIFDGVTLYRVVLPELISLYNAYLAGEESPLPEPLVQYPDYALWERDSVSPAATERNLDYWRRQLGDAPTLQLPLDHPRPAQQRFRGGMVPITISAELAAQLRGVGRRAGATLFQVIATAFAVMLHDYSGQDDVVFGTVTDLRRRPELEGVVGYCLTPLAVRADLRGDPSFLEVLHRVRATLVDALDHQVPFGPLVAELRPRREPGANPVFQAMVVLEPPMIATDPAWSVHQMDVEVGSALGHAKLDLHIELDERPQGHVAGRLIYNSDIFTAQTAQRAAGHWHTLLAGIAADPERAISALPLLSAQERDQLLVEWNDTAADYPREACIHDLVRLQAERTPDAVAVVFGERRLTYAELDARAESVAGRLRAAGAGPGTLVAVCIERSLDMMVGLLAVLKAGAGYVPLDPGHPARRLAFMIEDSGATILLTQADRVADLPEQRARVLCVDSTDGAGGPTAAVATATADDLAYVIYTSGSTGTPKGVRIRHRSVVNLLTSLARRPGLTAADTLLAVTTCSFDMSVPDLWLPLVTGATMVIAPAHVARDGRSLARLIAASGATFMQATPASWQMLVDSGWSGSEVLVALSGGDSLGAELAAWLAAHTAALWNAYGPTETTVWSSLARLQPGDQVTAGRPLANTRIYVLNAAHQPVPIGVAGEVFIGGDGVAAGYLNRPELTAERFVPDPHVRGATMYRTGDLGRLLVDGRLEHLGRLDQQLKVRGFRVEAGEVETALQAHPLVAAAVVTGRAGPDGSVRLVAHVVGDGTQPATADLRAHLRGLLPEHMVPSVFMALDALPLTANGKVDRNALPAPLWDTEQAAPLTAPRSATETRLAAIWAKTLAVQPARVGVDVDFFDLGGHSLLAARMLVEVEDELGVAVPLAAVIEGDFTVAGMAAIVDASRHHDELRGAVELQPRGRAPALFFFHADESTMLTLRHFIGPLGADQRVIGLLPGRSGRYFDRTSSVEELALPMLETIRSVQPHGPYYIAGFSIGALLAYEAAGRLEEAGEEVAWLGNLDCETPEVGRRLMWLRSPRGFLRRFVERGPRRAALKVGRIALRAVRAPLVALDVVPAPLTTDFDAAGARAIGVRYEIRGNRVPMELFVSADVVDMSGEPSLGWERVHRGTITVHPIPGTHLSMLTDPHVKMVASIVSESLRRAQVAQVAHPA